MNSNTGLQGRSTRSMKAGVSELKRMIELRMYSELERYADSFLQENGWQALRKQLRLVGSPKKQVCPFRLAPIPPGKHRDALVRLFDLYSTRGVDADMLGLFKNVEASSLDDLRAEIIPIATQALQDQVARGNTFFMDVDVMSTSASAVLVGDVIDERQREIQGIGHTCTLDELLATHYGFNMFMECAASALLGLQGSYGSSNVRDYDTRIEKTLKKMQTSLAGLVGFAPAMQIDRSIRHVHRGVFGCCTRNTASLLSSLANTILGSTPLRRNRALARLGSSGDSRASPFLEELLPVAHLWTDRLIIKGLNRRPDTNLRNSYLLYDVLASIGHAPVAERILLLQEPRMFLVHTLGKIRCDASIRELAKIASEHNPPELDHVLLALGSLYATRHIGLVEKRLPFHGRLTRPEAALMALLRLGKPGHQIILSHLEDVSRVLMESVNQSHIIGALVSIEGFSETETCAAFCVRELDEAYRMYLRTRQTSLDTSQNRQQNPIEIIDAISRTEGLLVRRDFVEYAARSGFLDFHDIQERNEAFFSELLQVVIDLFERDTDTLPLVRAVAEVPCIGCDGKVRQLLQRHGTSLLKQALTSTNIVTWLFRLSQTAVSPDVRQQCEQASALIPSGSSFAGEMTLPRLVSELKHSALTAVPESLLDAVVEQLYDANLYEAVLSSVLSKHKKIVDSVVGLIDPVLIDVLNRPYRYTRWVMPGYLADALLRLVSQSEAGSEMIERIWPSSVHTPAKEIPSSVIDAIRRKREPSAISQ
jgi:hypothetical protein